MLSSLAKKWNFPSQVKKILFTLNELRKSKFAINEVHFTDQEKIE